jgi:glycosyl transferase, family 25
MAPSQTPTRFDRTLLTALFDRVYVINLPDRTDRRREMTAQLALIGLENDPLVQFIPAVRPADPGDFGSLGERGCFLSHLAALKDAVAQGHRSILILEDDVDWTRAALASNARLDALRDIDWGFLHGGRGHDQAAADGAISLLRLDPERELLLGHFIGLRGAVISQMVHYLEAMLQRPKGSPEGGPMHVDGAYSWFRRAYPEVAAYVCAPSLAQQRSSRSDISVPTGWRATKAADWARRVLRPIRGMLRGR